MIDARPKILIIDDMPSNLLTLGAVLAPEFELQMATSGPMGLELAGQSPPDLILLDVMMPDMDGHEVCRRLKSDPATRSIPVIFVTAKDAEEDQELGFQLGGVDYITKPFLVSIVKARVRTHVLLKRQADELEKLSHIDALTGIANRRQLDSILDMECKRAAREGKPLSILMLDIDHFKEYNDRFGHGAGDECLCQIATTLARGLSRPGDLVARYGGEEFCVILPATDSTAAFLLAEQLRESILQLKLPSGSPKAGPVVSVSIGCATALTFIDDWPHHLIKRADTMLYCAKETGRNQTVI